MFCSTIFYEAQKYTKKRIHVPRASAKSGVRNSPSDVCLVVYECRGEHKVRPPEQHLRNLRSDNPTPHKKRANTRFAPTLTTLITADYFSLFTLHSSLFTLHFSLFTFRFSLFTFHFIRILVMRSPTRTTYMPEDSGRTWSPAEAFIVRTSEPTTVSGVGRVRRSAPSAA